MKKILASILFICVLWETGHACTTFFLNKNGQMVFGRNYDWVTGTGMVNTNLRGLAKTSLLLDKGNTISWVSAYGSTTFNQYGKEFPNGGMNDKGLVVELMWLADTEYPGADQRPGLNVLQWIQYQLDNCATVQEVLATDKTIRVVSTGTPQHYLVADANGKVATIEFLDGKMVTHSGKDLPFPVLTNSTYRQSVEFMKKNAARGNSGSFTDNSIDRFTRACSMVQQYQEKEINVPLVNYSFSILNKVAQGSFTKWSIVYDISNRKVYFKTQAFQQVKFFNLNDFDFTCAAYPLSFDMNQKAEGNINGRFSRFLQEQNKKLVQNAFTESRNEIAINEALQEKVFAYPGSVRCKQ